MELTKEQEATIEEWMRKDREVYVANEEEYHQCIEIYRKQGIFIASSFDSYIVGGESRSRLFPYDGGWNNTPYYQPDRHVNFSDLFNNTERLYETWI